MNYDKNIRNQTQFRLSLASRGASLAQALLTSLPLLLLSLVTLVRGTVGEDQVLKV